MTSTTRRSAPRAAAPSRRSSTTRTSAATRRESARSSPAGSTTAGCATGSSRSTPRCSRSSAAAGSRRRWCGAFSTMSAPPAARSRRAARSSSRTSSATRRTRTSWPPPLAAAGDPVARPADLRADQAHRGPREIAGAGDGSGRTPVALTGSSASRSATRHSQLAFSRRSAVEDVDRAAPELRGAFAGEPGADRRDRGPRHAEQVGEGFLGQREAVAADPVAGKQQPARRALVEAVQAVAGHGLGEVAEHRHGVVADQPAERLALPAGRPEPLRGQPLGRARRRGPRRPSGPVSPNAAARPMIPSEPTIVTPAVRPSAIVTESATSPDSGKYTRRTGACACMIARSASSRTRSRSRCRVSRSRDGSEASSCDPCEPVLPTGPPWTVPIWPIGWPRGDYIRITSSVPK